MLAGEALVTAGFEAVVLKRRSEPPSLRTLSVLRMAGSLTAALLTLKRMSSPPSLRRGLLLLVLLVVLLLAVFLDTTGVL